MLSEKQGAVPEASECQHWEKVCSKARIAPAEPTLSLETATMSDPSAPFSRNQLSELT